MISGLQIATSHSKDYPPGTITYPIPEKSLLSRWSSGFPQMGYGFVPWRVSWIPFFLKNCRVSSGAKILPSQILFKKYFTCDPFPGVKNWFVRKILEPPFFFSETQGINWVKLRASRSRQVQPTELRSGPWRFSTDGCFTPFVFFWVYKVGLMIINCLVNGFNSSEKNISQNEYLPQMGWK